MKFKITRTLCLYLFCGDGGRQFRKPAYRSFLLSRYVSLSLFVHLRVCMFASESRRPTVYDKYRSTDMFKLAKACTHTLTQSRSQFAYVRATSYPNDECMCILFAHVTLNDYYFCCLRLAHECEALTKLIRAIRILPLVFQLMVDDTKNIIEHSVSMMEIQIGTNSNV